MSQSETEIKRWTAKRGGVSRLIAYTAGLTNSLPQRMEVTGLGKLRRSTGRCQMGGTMVITSARFCFSRASKSWRRDSFFAALFFAASVVLVSPVFADDKKAAGGKEIHVFIDQQVLQAFEGDEEVFRFDVVTGKDGKETTAGRYKIFRKHEQYTSKTYGSEMPYTMFFTDDGKAIHGTLFAPVRSYLHSLGVESVGSHGCVGLTDDNAKILFDWAPKGTPVVVIRDE